MRKTIVLAPRCPCGGGKSYSDCCQPYHAGLPAPTAATLMRSRYSAYVLKLEPYLLHTWHCDTRPASLNLRHDPTCWTDLTLRHQVQTSEHEATVEFLARYKVNGKAGRLHETSRFIRHGNAWYYVDGDIHRDSN